VLEVTADKVRVNQIERNQLWREDELPVQLGAVIEFQRFQTRGGGQETADNGPT
jgi:hypothetical protein